MTKASAAERFASKWHLDPSGCHVWQGFTDKGGYGQFWDGKNHKAHRYALSQATGQWPHHRVLALHTCDNPPCVNPDHLFWGSHQDNTADMVQKGRQKYCGRPRKLTKAQREEIRAAYVPRKHGPNSMKQLAERYGVTKAAIHAVIHRQSHIDHE